MKKKNKKGQIDIIKILSIASISVVVITIILEILEKFFQCRRDAVFSCIYINETAKEIYNTLNAITSSEILYYIHIIMIICTIIIFIIAIKKATKLPKSTITLAKTALILYAIMIFVLPFISIIITTSESSTEVKKPIIYIYPTEKTKLKITLNNSNKITHSYPKYDNGWEIIVDKNSNIYDINTKRNYYALYWEGIDNTKINEKVGFVVAGKDTTKFLEEKLSYLGLNDKESNEFIVYWLPKLENNKYNYIRFRTKEEIETYNKINIDHKVDSLIQVYMDYKPLDKKINVKEQKLEKAKRQGFTIVEWGGRQIK
ncbi:MAG: hypothetical protein IJI43_00230 [Bacilli bacterium]|nr:hypothetical protein [Bacilli bacterium]